MTYLTFEASANTPLDVFYNFRMLCFNVVHNGDQCATQCSLTSEAPPCMALSINLDSMFEYQIHIGVGPPLLLQENQYQRMCRPFHQGQKLHSTWDVRVSNGTVTVTFPLRLLASTRLVRNACLSFTNQH